MLSVTSNEPSHDGDTAPDWVIVDAHHVRLRRERSGEGQGRIYTIDVKCTDSGGGTTRQSVQVPVRKSKA